MVMLCDTAPAAIETASLAAQGWRMVAASVRGPMHEANNGVREDAFAIRIQAGAAIVVVCDGAGSVTHAADGAAGFSACVAEGLAAAALPDWELDQFRANIIESVEAQRRLFEGENGNLADYGTTLVALLARPERIFLAHVGDGLAGVAEAGKWEKAVLSRPANGEYANETFFVTDTAWQGQLRCGEAPGLGHGGAAVVLTDGAMPFVISVDEKGLSPEFMAPVARYFAQACDDEAAASLAGTLGSAEARRIKDDKTLVWLAVDI